MKGFKKNILMVILWLIGLVPVLWVYAIDNVKLFLPMENWEDDLNIGNTQVHTEESNILDYVKTINANLWFAIAWISMAVLIYAWIQLITAWWDKWKVSKWWKLALSCLVAIIVAMLSYLLVRLVLSLF